MKIAIPNDVQYIISTLEQHNYEAYVVGGCVRDSLLGKHPDDWDITTSANPQQVKELFTHTIDTGLQHGTVTVRINHTNYEVTTFRVEEDYIDSRHPSKVYFTKQIADDLNRRDFTINAMAYNPKSGLVDLYNGQQDLQNHIIRCVGNPHERFTEDALRILRALRFSAQLNFDIDTNTLQAIRDCAPLLLNISAERIHTEFTKLLISNHPEKIEDAYTSGVTKIILPEFDLMMSTTQNNPHHCYSVGKHTIESLKHIPKDPILRYSMLFHDLGKPVCKTTDTNGIDHFRNHQLESVKIATNIMKRWKFDNHSISLIKRYVEHHDYRFHTTEKSIRKAIAKIGVDLFPNFFYIKKADLAAQSNYQKEEKLNTLHLVESIYTHIINNNQCLSTKDLAINGKHLLDIGIPSGPAIGNTLNTLLELVLDDPSLNTVESLILYCKKHIL